MKTKSIRRTIKYFQTFAQNIKRDYVCEVLCATINKVSEWDREA